MTIPPYRLRVPEETVRFLRKLHPEIKRHLRKALEMMLHDPFCGKALKDDLEGLRSFRVKRYRLVYRVVSEVKEIETIAIGPRRNIYEETFRLISLERSATRDD